MLGAGKPEQRWPAFQSKRSLSAVRLRDTQALAHHSVLLLQEPGLGEDSFLLDDTGSPVPAGTAGPPLREGQ